MSLITPPTNSYEAERQALLRLIAMDGEWMHVMSPSTNSGVLCRGIRLLGGYVLTEYGEIAAPDRWLSDDSFDEVLTTPETP